MNDYNEHYRKLMRSMINDIFSSFKNPFEPQFGSSFTSMQFSSSNSMNEDTDFKYPKDNDPNYNKTVETSENDTHIVKKEIWVSVSGNHRLERVTETSKRAAKTKAEPTLEELKDLRHKAVVEQRYEDAAILRDKIKELENIKDSRSSSK